jgi:hypothetical protein
MARRNPAAPSRKDAARRLENIKDQMEVLNEEALAIVDEAGDMLEYGRAYMYWYGNISNALEGDQVSMEQTIASLREPREEVVRENPRRPSSRSRARGFRPF